MNTSARTHSQTHGNCEKHIDRMIFTEHNNKIFRLDKGNWFLFGVDTPGHFICGDRTQTHTQHMEKLKIIIIVMRKQNNIKGTATTTTSSKESLMPEMELAASINRLSI